MNYKIEKIQTEDSKILEAQETEIGDLMEIIDKGSNKQGQIILHHYSGFASLDDPSCAWGKDCPLRVRLLPKGAVIKLTVE